MLLYGAGGHAKVVCSSLEANGILINGIFDDDPSLKHFQNIALLGGYTKKIIPGEEIIMTIGDNKIREKLSGMIEHTYGNTHHPSALIDTSVIVGKGTVILHGCVIQRDVSIGNHVIVNTSASVDHDCFIHDFVHIAPNSTLCGAVEVGTGTLIGAGSVIHPRVRIGRWCTIAVGAIVFRDVPDHSVVIGNPGRIMKKK